MKKLVALLLAGLMLVTCVPALAFTDTEGTPCEDAAKVLSAIGIAEGKGDGAFDPEGSLTRAEMVTITMRLRGMGDMTGGEQVFEDVPPTHYAFSAVSRAKAQGIVNGTSETTFSPDAPLTFAQAVKMLVGAMGYGIAAESEGGFPAGYLSVASRIGLLKGAKTDEAITRGTMAIIAYNALDTALFIPKSYGTDDTKYEENENKTILSQYLHIEKAEGRLTGNYYTATGAAPALRKNEVSVDNAVMNAGKTDAADYLLQHVTVYAKETETDVPEILVVLPKKNVETKTILAEDISPRTTAAELYYLEGDREKSVKIPSAATVIINGREKTAPYAAADFMPEMGTVTLISTGSVPEGIIVSSYKNYIVKSKNEETDTVYFMEAVGGTRSMVLDTADSARRIDLRRADGSEIKVSEMEEWGILSVSESADSKVVRAVYSDAVVYGTISEIAKDVAVIGEKQYTIAKSMETTTLKKPEVSLAAAYYLDASGCIAAVDANDTGMQGAMRYAYLMAAGNTKGMGARAQLKLFVEDGTIQTFDVANRVKLNESSVSADELLPPRGNKIYTGTEAIRQLIRFEINLADLITKIETAEDYTANFSDESRLDVFSKDIYINENNRIVEEDGTVVRGNFKGGTLALFSSRYMPREKTKIFVIPDKDAEDKEYSMMTYRQLKHDSNGGRYTYSSLYDIDEANIIGAMVWDVGAAGASASGNVPVEDDTAAVVIDMYEGITDSGDTKTFITLMDETRKQIDASINSDLEVYFAHALTNVKTDPLCVGSVRPAVIDPASISIGDVVQFKTNTAGEITMLNLIFRNEYPGEFDQAWQYYGTWYGEGIDAGNNYAGLSSGYATVDVVGDYSVKARVGALTANGMGAQIPGKEYVRTYPRTGALFLYDREEEKLSVIDYDDIREGDRMYVLWKSTVQVMLVVYR